MAAPAFDAAQFVASRRAKEVAGRTPTGNQFDPLAFLKQRQAGQTPTQRIPSKLLRTETGLQQATKKVGLEKEAQRVLSEKGEAPDRIFSGGRITDIFDALNALDYGSVGLLKGKGFVEGLKTRESFTKGSELADPGLFRFLVGVALDIAVDPLTYSPLAPASIVSKVAKIPGVAKVASKVADTVASTRFAQELGTRFVFRFGQDPIYRTMDERRIKNIGVGTEQIMTLARPIAKLNKEAQRRIAEARKAGNLETLPDDLKALARPAFDELDKLGKEAVDAGLLSAEKYEENVGRYLARFYESKELEGPASKALKGIFPAKPLRIDLARFKSRQDIPEEIRQAMGEILEAGYPTAKAMVQLKNAVENAKFFTQVAKTFVGKLEDGFVALPKTDRLGELSGKAVPAPIADSINEIIRTKTNYEKITEPIVASFKFGKVILNPATHARNMVSNLFLNEWEGLNPLKPSGIKAYATAAKEMATKGPLYREAKAAGLGLDSFAASEIKGYLTDSAVKKLGPAITSKLDAIANVYQKEEEFAKMAQYIFQRTENKLSSEEAWKIAERATFNYAQVTPSIRWLRTTLFGLPFITFTAKVTPQVARTVYKRPTSISNIGKIKNAIENQTNPEELKAEREDEADWIRDGFYVKLPFKDEEGRSAYFDLTYILPFGDLVSGQLFESGISRETGLPENAARTILRKSPAANLIAELVTNQDFYGNKIFKNSDSSPKKAADYFRHIVKTYLPPLLADQVPGGYRSDTERRLGTIHTAVKKARGIEEGGLQTRTLMQEMLKVVGIKISPIDLALQSKYGERERIKALQTLLEENGFISKFEIPFSPRK